MTLAVKVALNPNKTNQLCLALRKINKISYSLLYIIILYSLLLEALADKKIKVIFQGR